MEEEDVEISDEDRCSSLVCRCDDRLPERPRDRGVPLLGCDRLACMDTGEYEGVVDAGDVVVRPPSSLGLDLEPDERFSVLERGRRSPDAIISPL